MTSIVLADDHHIVRQGLRALLEGEHGFDVIGEASDGYQALDLVEHKSPEVLIIDLMMPNLNGLEVVRQVSERWPQTRSIVLSMHADESYVLEALKNGVSGYVLKESIAEDLVRAIKEVVQGRLYLGPPLSNHALELYRQHAKFPTDDPYEILTTREREVLQLAAEGRSNKEIAEKFTISHRTVETHRANLMRKLDLQNQSELVRYAIKRGILPLEE